MRRLSRATLCIVFVLVMAISSGGGVAGDAAGFLAYMRAAAEQGGSFEQYILGDSYELGDGMLQDFVEAVKWYRRAAEQGYEAAQNRLGGMYSRGKGVPEDYVLAHMWFNLAASRGHSSAVRRRDVVARKMTGEQIAEAQRLAREWKPKPE